MDAVFLIVGLFILWLWLKGHPFGALVAFLAMLFSPVPVMVMHADSIPTYFGYSAALALAPMTIIWLYRDLRKGKGGRLSHFGDRLLTDLGAPPVPQAPKPEGQVHLDNYSWSKTDLKAWAPGFSARKNLSQLERGYLLLGVKPIASDCAQQATADQPYEQPGELPRQKTRQEHSRSSAILVGIEVAFALVLVLVITKMHHQW